MNIPDHSMAEAKDYSRLTEMAAVEPKSSIIKEAANMLGLRVEEVSIQAPLTAEDVVGPNKLEDK